MNRWQKLAMLGLAGTLLLSFWAGLWYQAQRLAPVAELVNQEIELESEESRSELGLEVYQKEATEEGLKAEKPLTEEEEKGLAVHVVGQVASAGVYYLAPGSRIYDAVILAQPLNDAHLDLLNLALPIEDGMQVRVPKQGGSLSWNDGQLVVYPEQALTEEGVQGKINLNTASQTQLESLPGIGPVYAKRIIEYRQQKGNFKQVEDLKQIKGIGTSILSNIKDLVVCS